MRMGRSAAFGAGILVVLFSLGMPQRACAQTGSVAFTVHLTPSGGIAEPVRGLPFYLLRKSYAEIQKEADAAVPKPDLTTFIDTLTVSKELKAWMEKNHTARITGQEFTEGLTADDIIKVPEFWKAYFTLNAPNKNFGFPVPRFKDSDTKTDPEKYHQEMSDYHAKVARYILLHPESKDGMDSSLESIDPSPQWNTQQEARGPAIKRLVMDFTQSKYFVAQTQTDVYGNAGFTGVPPGTYWISSLSVEAQVGDVNARWDVPVTIRAGAETKVGLSNYNAAPGRQAH